MSSASFIEISHVSKSFDGGQTHAVRDVSMSISAGRFLAIVGGSGSGKTTTLKFINRLIEPDAGEVRIDGKAIHTVNGWRHRQGIGYVFQAIGLFPHMNIEQNIGITPKLLGWSSRRIAERTKELFDLVGLPQSYSSRVPHSLSGGEQQRAALARAIAARPAIVLLDEPFAALDPVTRDSLGTAYRRIHSEAGLTTLMVTHDVQEAVLLADQIAIMGGGRVLQQGTPHALMSSPESAEVEALMNMPKRQAQRISAILDQALPIASHA